MNNFISFKKAAEILNCSSTSLYKLLTEGKIFGKKNNGKWLLDSNSINSFISNGGYIRRHCRDKDSLTLRHKIKDAFKEESNILSKRFLKNSDFKINWEYALKIATDRFYTEKTIESAQYLTEVQRLYKRDDMDGYLNLLNGGYYNGQVKGSF